MVGEELNPVHEITEAMIVARRILRWKGLGGVKLRLVYECRSWSAYHTLCDAIDLSLLAAFGSAPKLERYATRAVIELAGATIEIRVIEDAPLDWRNPGETK